MRLKHSPNIKASSRPGLRRLVEALQLEAECFRSARDPTTTCHTPIRIPKKGDAAQTEKR